ncbi:disease resistance protein Pik-2-like [Hordeum vulgare subsp. vulgare]|uniref:Disease resistance protein RPM1 n=1 Tax=Hordeum vulgare subsp. vulgare TaxID=112509 RepID=A0A8I6WCP1_HORVV|nr:disease resistance protein Pik-2-like [Hordeum vulgare subsp. vulgare]
MCPAFAVVNPQPIHTNQPPSLPMEATTLSVGKSVLNGAISYATSALAEEVALQLGVRRDQVFITNELEMMQAFLMSAHDEGDDNRVVKVWVKQVRDVAYDVEDTLQEFAVRLKKQSWWRIRRNLLDRRHVAKQMKDLRANVEDVSQRNMRYNLIKGSGFKAAMAAEQPSITSASLFGIHEARRMSRQEKSKLDLYQLINQKESGLRVIAVWGTSAELGQISIVRGVYENQETKGNFPCRAWVRLMHPFNAKDFIQSMVEQFHMGVGAKALLQTEKTAQELAEKFDEFVRGRRYLIVINDLNTIEVWDRVKSCFPNDNMGSRIIVSTAQVEVASLCAGQESIVSELKQSSGDDNIYAFHEKVSQDGTDLTKTKSSSNRVITSSGTGPTVPMGEISEDQSKGADRKDALKKSFTRSRTMATVLEESHLIGREKEIVEIIKLISDQPTQELQVITVWGMGGLGKTTLVKDIYGNQELSAMFEKRAWVTVMRPFNLEGLLRSLIMQLDRESSETKTVVGLMGSTRNTLLLMPLLSLIEEMGRLTEKKRCLIVLDDVSSSAEWNMITPNFHGMEYTSRIMVTTREENLAKLCSRRQENIYMLKDLDHKDARDLFTKKVFKETTDLDLQYPDLVEHAELILRRCGRLPLAIATIGGFLSNQPKSSLEWRKLNDHISAELEMNPEFGTIRTVLMRSYDGLPYHLKSCFLYMPIFPEDYKVGRGRLTRRWSAEGYSREVRGRSAEEIADSYFMELISRSMILPSQQSICSTKGISSCQVHDLIREIGVSKSMKENLVFTLEDGCSSNSQTMVRHLAISSNWKGDKSEFESMVDMSRLRSITCFGEWRSFFVSDKMRLLRVLDLQDTTGLVDHHLNHIGKFLHLRYLSLRGCDYIFYLPDSLGNLRQLETLDVRGTRIVKLPKSIIKLCKLNYLRASKKPINEDVSYEEFMDFPKVMEKCPCHLCLLTVLFCLVCCGPQCFAEGDEYRYDACTVFCCHFFLGVAMSLDMYGVLVPRGMRKLKALHTLGVVNIGRRRKVVLQDIKRLTQLRKLGVTGINKENGQELCSAIVGLSRLESLSIRSEGEPGLCGCLDGKFSFPETLQSLKLYGNLVKLPEWVQGLKNLVKLKLQRTMLSEDNDAMQLLGKLPNLVSLHLLWKSICEGEVLCFHEGAFPSLVLLEIGSYVSVKFEHGAIPTLELIKHFGVRVNSDTLSGLPYLSSLKEVALEGYYNGSEMAYLRAELAENPNRPVLKTV